MKQEVNYLTHHKEVFSKMLEEETITPIDISIYNALFLLWNSCGFDSKLSINRNEVMMLSKIGNSNTYTKSLKKLDSLGYIKYFPSFNPMKGSTVTMCRFDIGTAQGSGVGTAHGGVQASAQGGATLSKLNKLNKQEKEKPKNLNSEILNFSNPSSTSYKIEDQEKEKSSAKKEKELEPFKDLLIQNGAEGDDIDEWFKLRIENRKPTTRYYVEKFIMECKKNNFSVKEAVEACAFNGWINFNYDWIVNSKQSKSKSSGKSESNPNDPKIGRANLSDYEKLYQQMAGS